MVEVLASGTHAGLSWHVETTDTALRSVTVQGFIGPRYVFKQMDFQAPTPASVKRLCEALAKPVKK